MTEKYKITRRDHYIGAALTGLLYKKWLTWWDAIPTAVEIADATIEHLKQLEQEEKDSHIPKGVLQMFKLPDGWDTPEMMEALSDFKSMRTRMKKPMTDRAGKRLITKLRTLSNEHMSTAILILHRSVDRGWTDVYPLEGERKKTRLEEALEEL